MKIFGTKADLIELWRMKAELAREKSKHSKDKQFIYLEKAYTLEQCAIQLEALEELKE
jgi:hypothetical protein